MNSHITVDQLIDTCDAMVERFLYSADSEVKELALRTIWGISLQLSRMTNQIAGEG